jgi:hypothetical protein
MPQPFSSRVVHLLRVPAAAQHNVIADNSTLREIWEQEHQLPPPAPTLFLHTASSLLSEDQPSSVNIINILALKSLPLKTIELLYGEINMRETTKPVSSVFHPDARDRRFPLWTLTLWARTESIRLEANAWSACIRALEKEKLPQGEAQAALQAVLLHIPSLPWNGSIRIHRYSVHVPMLRRVLLRGVEGWLNSSLVDVFMARIRHDVEMDPKLREKVVVSDLGVWERIEAKKYDSRVLAEVIKLVGNGCERLVLPTVDSKHWVPFRISFKTNQVTYGECSDRQPGGLFTTHICVGDPMNTKKNARRRPTVVLRKLHDWLKVAFPTRSFSDTKDAMEHGEQTDFESCGLFMENTTRREIWPDTPILQNGNCMRVRLELFEALFEEGVVSFLNFL